MSKRLRDNPFAGIPFESLTEPRHGNALQSNKWLITEAGTLVLTVPHGPVGACFYPNATAPHMSVVASTSSTVAVAHGANLSGVKNISAIIVDMSKPQIWLNEIGRLRIRFPSAPIGVVIPDGAAFWAMGTKLYHLGVDRVFPVKPALNRHLAAWSETMLTATAAGARVEMKLSERRQQVLLGVTLGVTSPALADALQVSKETVDTHREGLQEKLGTARAPELVREAFRRGLLPSPRFHHAPGLPEPLPTAPVLTPQQILVLRTVGTDFAPPRGEVRAAQEQLKRYHRYPVRATAQVSYFHVWNHPEAWA